ncbi:MAG TPA: hypothetical protein VI408_11095 [Gaiellaceae bacterium]
MTTLALPRPSWLAVRSPDAWLAAAAFAAFSLAVLVRHTALIEPDDLAYRASILALVHGHLTLSTAEYDRLTQVAQWVQLPNGRWISEKNPGYPFFAAPFQLVGLLRLAPLVYGALGCIGLYAGGRRFAGRTGGLWAVLLYLGTGSALVFAWRATMPTFTDASLVAGGTGALLWTFLADDASPRRRALVGLAAFASLEAATSMRYTDGIVLLVAVAAALVVRAPGWRWHLLSVGAFAALVATFDKVVYGGFAKTGYASGEITFSTGAIVPNLEHMPRHLLLAMPTIALAAAAVVWIALRRVRREVLAGAFLAACWAGVFALYLAYDWTVRMSQGDATVHVVRFYAPALGAVALLAGWLVRRLRAWTPLVVLAAVVAFAAVSYPELATGGLGGPPPGGAMLGR